MHLRDIKGFWDRRASEDSPEQPSYLLDKYESGTMNLPGIIGLHAALTYLEEETIEKLYQKKMELTEYFLQEIQRFPWIRVIGEQEIENRVSVVSLNFQGMDNSMAAFELEQKYQIMTRVGLHCAPKAHETLGTFLQDTVRFAFSAANRKEEIDVCIRAFEEMNDL